MEPCYSVVGRMHIELCNSVNTVESIWERHSQMCSNGTSEWLESIDTRK